MDTKKAITGGIIGASLLASGLAGYSLGPSSSVVEESEPCVAVLEEYGEVACEEADRIISDRKNAIATQSFLLERRQQQQACEVSNGGFSVIGGKAVCTIDGEDYLWQGDNFVKTITEEL